MRPGRSSGAYRRELEITFWKRKEGREMASDKVVQAAIKQLNNELVQIRHVLERIVAALERQAPPRMI
jgi:hypothetical protein